MLSRQDEICSNAQDSGPVGSSMNDSSNRREQVDRLLEAIRNGNNEAMDELMPLIYDELRRLAHSRLRYERNDHTLRTTALVNEAYMRLVKSPSQDWKNRAYFFGAAARSMRQILIQHQRSRSRLKRSSDERQDVEVGNIVRRKDSMSVRLDEVLYELERVSKTQADIVEKHYFAGLTLEEIAEVMNISLSTVKRQWRHAKAWLRREMGS